jgi:ribonuclease R
MATPEQMVQFLRENKGLTFKPRQIMERLNIPVREKRAVREMLRELAQAGKIVRFKRGVYSIPGRQRVIEGVFQSSRTGGGFVVCKGTQQEDVRVPRYAEGAALNGDWVEATILGETRGKPEGRITQVVQHAHRNLVGQYLHTPNGGLVLPRDERIARRVKVLRRHSPKEIPEGAWVVVEIVNWSESKDDPLIGRVTEVLGTDDDKGIDILLLIRGKGAKIDFPEEVLKEAEACGDSIPESEISRRRDLRKMAIFTIDPETAKDFDDALSIERIDKDVVRLGVHIADVSQYVRPGTALEAEAYERSTSIYPVDRVVPMLPPALSDGLCSLRPNEDRLTMSVFMDIGRDCEILNTDVCESVIHSQFRLTYEEAQAVFDNKPFDRAEKVKAIHKELRGLRDLSLRLTEMRMKRGALDLDLPETDIILDKDGKTVDVRPHPRLQSHRLVEECMLLANEAVAALLEKRSLPGLYRVHEEPDPLSLDRLRLLLMPFGARLPKKKVERNDLQAALDKIKDIQGGGIVMRLILRSLKRARYSERNLGHFGLASARYSHFTSPIRRYPDLLVHRVLKEFLPSMSLPAERRQELIDAMPEIAAHTSNREELATEIERDATDVKSLEFMKPRLGEVFDGMISGIARFGLFVQLDPWPIEGLIPVRSLDDDYYDFDELTNTLRGRNSGRKFSLAEKVRVIVERVDPPARQMDLALVQSGGARRWPETSKKKKGKKGRKKK